MILRRPLSRRRFLAVTAASTAISAVGGIARPYLSRAADRPVITHGIQSGDVSIDSGVVWARADRPARMLVEIATTDSFKTIRRAVFVDALPETDFTAKALIEGLPAGQDIFYRIRFQDLASPTIVGEPVIGRFRTAPADRRSVSFVWSGDTAGQGWGIDEARGGMRTYATMLRNRPDFFIHCGDTIYADGPIAAEQKLPDGRVWRNVVTEEKSKVGRDARRVPRQLQIQSARRERARLQRRGADLRAVGRSRGHQQLVAGRAADPRRASRKKYVERTPCCWRRAASRAFHEYMPMRATLAEPGRVYRKISYGPLLDVFMLDMRSYRGPNAEGLEESYGPAAYFLGPTQVAWLKRELIDSQATWKVIAADMPIGLVVSTTPTASGASRRSRKAMVRRAAASSRSPTCCRFIKRAGIRNTRLAHRRRALHRGALLRSRTRRCSRTSSRSGNSSPGRSTPAPSAPNALDNTFGPQRVYVKAPGEQGPNLPPSEGLQFFGHVAIDGATEVMTVTLKDVDDSALWSTTLEPKLG